MASLTIEETDLDIPYKGGKVTSVCLLEGGRLAIGSLDTMVQVWETNDDFRTNINFQRSLNGHTAPVSHLCMLSERRLASASQDKTVRIWDASGKCLHILEHSNVVTSICAIDDTHLVSASWDNQTGNCLVLWNFVTGETKNMLDGHRKPVMSVCSLGDQQFASGSLDHTVWVWNADNGKCLQVLEGHTDGVTSVCALGDGRIVSGSVDKTLRVWDSASGACRHVLRGHTEWVTSVCVVSNLLIVSTSEDTTVRVWDARDGRSIQVISPEDVWPGLWMQKVFDLFHGNLAFIYSDNTVHFWQLKQQGFRIATGGYRTKRRRMKKPYKNKKARRRTRKCLT